MSLLRARIAKRLAAPGSPAFDLQAEIAVSGGFTILFGPSGAGKSTLLDCIAGLLRPDQGHIHVNDQVLFDRALGIDVPPSERSIAYVFQRAVLFPHLSVEENVNYGLAHLRADEREHRVAHILEVFRIAALRRRMPREISGGEQQRVALARSLVTEPRVLLLDEPLSALDAKIKRKILDDLLAWNNVRPIPILYVTHSHAESLALGGRMIRLNEGRVVAEGTPAEVLAGEEVLD
jgi:molybdate transport system ATP-binding protein